MSHFMGFSYEPAQGLTSGGPRYRKMEQIDSPAERWVFIDEHEDSIWGGEFSFLLIQWLNYDWADIPAARHGGSGTFSFADGHAESRRWVNPRTRVPVKRVRQYGIPGGGNVDVKWLWLRTTTPEPAYMP